MKQPLPLLKCSGADQFPGASPSRGERKYEPGTHHHRLSVVNVAYDRLRPHGRRPGNRKKGRLATAQVWEETPCETANKA